MCGRTIFTFCSVSTDVESIPTIPHCTCWVIRTVPRRNIRWPFRKATMRRLWSKKTWSSNALCLKIMSLGKSKLNLRPAIQSAFMIWSGRCAISCAAAAAISRSSVRLWNAMRTPKTKIFTNWWSTQISFAWSRRFCVIWRFSYPGKRYPSKAVGKIQTRIWLRKGYFLWRYLQYCSGNYESDHVVSIARRSLMARKTGVSIKVKSRKQRRGNACKITNQQNWYEGHTHIFSRNTIAKTWIS